MIEETCIVCQTRHEVYSGTMAKHHLTIPGFPVCPGSGLPSSTTLRPYVDTTYIPLWIVKMLRQEVHAHQFIAQRYLDHAIWECDKSLGKLLRANLNVPAIEMYDFAIHRFGRGTSTSTILKTTNNVLLITPLLLDADIGEQNTTSRLTVGKSHIPLPSMFGLGYVVRPHQEVDIKFGSDRLHDVVNHYWLVIKAFPIADYT